MDNLNLNISEIEQFISQAQRENTKRVLQEELKKLQDHLKELQDKELEQQKLVETQSNPAKPLVFEAIKNYSWDQENSDIVWFTKKHQHKIA